MPDSNHCLCNSRKMFPNAEFGNYLGRNVSLKICLSLSLFLPCLHNGSIFKQALKCLPKKQNKTFIFPGYIRYSE